MKRSPATDPGAELASLEAQLAAALLAGGDTAPIRAAIAGCRAAAAANVVRASNAAAAEQSNLAAAINAAAAVRASVSRSAIAGRLAELQPPSFP